MDPVTTSVVAILAPALVGLLKRGSEGVVQEVASKLGADAWDQARRLWEKLRPEIEAKPGALELAQDLASDPGSQDLRTAFGVQVEKLLKERKKLADEIGAILSVDSSTRVSVEGAGAVGGGRDVSVGQVVNNFLGSVPGVNTTDLPRGRALSVMIAGFLVFASGFVLFFVVFAVAVATDSPSLLILMPAVFGLAFIGIFMISGAAIYARIKARSERDQHITG